MGTSLNCKTLIAIVFSLPDCVLIFMILWPISIEELFSIFSIEQKLNNADFCVAPTILRNDSVSLR